MDDDIFRIRPEWSFQEFEALRKAVNMTEHEIADAVGLTHRYIYVNTRLGNDRHDKRPVMGARASHKVNMFVTKYLTEDKPDPPPVEVKRGRPRKEPEVTTHEEPLYGLAAVRRVFDMLNELRRAEIKDRIATYFGDDQANGYFLVRHAHTKCPKCGHADDRKFEFRGVAEAQRAYEEAKQWLERG